MEIIWIAIIVCIVFVIGYAVGLNVGNDNIYKTSDFGYFSIFFIVVAVIVLLIFLIGSICVVL